MPRLSKIGAAALAAFGWTTGASAVSASYLVVAGGGASGGGNGTFIDAGGGGAGGLLSGTTSLNLTLSYTIVVGAGGVGAPSTSANARGTAGSSSSFNSIVPIGGGPGGVRDSAGTINNGVAGGSGGGAAINPSGTASGTGGAGTAGQGFAGGTAYAGASNYGGGGGGGAGAVGTNAPVGGGGNGGVGVSSSISGTATFYAGGGGGGSRGGTAGTGGSGGGGNGALNTNPPSSGTANTGGGAGATTSTGSIAGANGGSGIVIISYVGAQQFGGGIVTTSGANTIHTFTTSGTLSPLSTLSASYLIVAGGAGGGGLGGGGAGGLLSGSGVTIDTNSTYLVTVGAGGAGSGAARGTNGGNSAFSIVSTSAVGGGGGGLSGAPRDGLAGGSGGGGGSNLSGFGVGGAGTSGQGNTGGTAFTNGTLAGVAAGGGGGASAVGVTATAGVGGAGGAGTASSISGTSVTYAGGGGGGTYSGTPGAGGSGGGGKGANASAYTVAVSGTANTGGGGGGSDANGDPAGDGGSGIVIISYAGSTQQMAGGTVTISGGNVIHTFTSSGYLTPLKLVGNSLRFRGSASAYLNRTPSVVSNRQTWTWSGWVKIGALDSSKVMFSAGSSSSVNIVQLFFSSNSLSFQIYDTSQIALLQSTAVYRDPAAWYHVVAVINTTASTSTNRMQLYVNGVQLTSFSTATYPAQNFNAFVNTVTDHSIGNLLFGSRTNQLDGYLAEVNFIDGQALTPNSFGTFNSYGVWQPITYGGSYGTNGFYLPFNAGTSTFTGSFNGSSQYLTVPANAAFNMGSGDFTIEAWVYTTSTGRQAIISQINSAGTTVSSSFYLEKNASGFFRISLGSGGTPYDITGTTTLPVNQWVHVALVRNGNTAYAYMNGILQGTVSVTGISINSSTELLQISGYGNTATLLLTGAISNVRIVKGTAVYTASFTPPTANLTAISGTSLLTLQNTTIIDNSTNAFTITNTGTVTTAQTYPFSAAKIFNDQSPQGNNWTPNNISGASGSTLDYMTDVPTLTSATAANYCVWNPLNKSSSQSVTNGNLTSSSSGGTSYGALCATMGATSGKWYWEMTYTRNGTSNSPVIGFGNDLFTYTNPPGGYLGSDLNAGGVNVINGNAAINGTSTAYGSAIVSNDVVMFAMDLDNRKFYVGKNGTWFNSGNPVTGTNQWPYSATIVGSTFFPAVNMFNDSAAANFGQQPFAYTPPSGFLALNTFNL